MIRLAHVFAAAGLVFAWFAAPIAPAAAQIVIPTVPVAHPCNAPDPLTGNVFGTVAQKYAIGTTEVTNAQYAAFLNAVAATDAVGLYSSNMAGSRGGIARAGMPGSYTYPTVSGRENSPVNYVSFWNACRFANWLHNGQPAGPQNATTTEDGAYTLTPAAVSANTVVRNPGWRWAVPSENEWYKAAFFQPSSLGGDTDGYWQYTTRGNSRPTDSQANIRENGRNNTTSVGSYAANFYGAFDMGGNVFEWNEAVDPSGRCIRGGSYDTLADGLASVFRLPDSLETSEGSELGFRISSRGCPGDFDGIGGASVQYIFDFLAAWFAGNPATANFNCDCCVSTQDIFDFLAAWFQSC